MNQTESKGATCRPLKDCVLTQTPKENTINEYLKKIDKIMGNSSILSNNDRYLVGLYIKQIVKKNLQSQRKEIFNDIMVSGVIDCEDYDNRYKRLKRIFN